MKKEKKKIKGIACSVFRREIEGLIEAGEVDFPVIFLDSMLHLVPEKLNVSLEKTIKKCGISCTVLFYGDCSPNIRDLEKNPSISKIQAVNCCEALLEREEYKEYRDKGAFFLLPEWIYRWKEIFFEKLGLKGKLARDLMKEHHKYFLYLHTGFNTLPQGELDEISKYFELPVEIKQVTLKHFLKRINNAIGKFNI